MSEPCKNCPPAMQSGWNTCKNPECAAQYKDYEGLYHSSLCPKCSAIRQSVERFDRASVGRFAGMRTNAPVKS